MEIRKVYVCAGSTLAETAATWIADCMRDVIASRRRCMIALSGGTTPGPVYACLAEDPLAKKVDWSKVHVFFADERCVPPTDPESNYGMVERLLLSKVPIPGNQVYRMEAERDDVLGACAEYERVLPTQLDILLLGMGADGHTASLFPGSSAVDELRHLVVPAVGPKPPPRRMTITPPVIEQARAIVTLVAGIQKSGALVKALEGKQDAREVPAGLARRGVWFLDPPAAAQLSRSTLAT